MIIGIVFAFASPIIENDIFSMGKVFGRFPSRFFVAFPLDLIFDAPFAFLSAYLSVFKNAIYFVFFFTIHQIRRWTRKVRSMNLRLFVWGKEYCMERIMNVPFVW